MILHGMMVHSMCIIYIIYPTLLAIWCVVAWPFFSWLHVIIQLAF